MDPAIQFNEVGEKNVFSTDHRQKLQSNIEHYNRKVQQGKAQYSNIELAKMRAGAIKNKTTEHLDKFLIEFEANFIKRGGKIIWAQDIAEAQKEITAILKKKDISSVVKSKSMVTEEIKLNEHLLLNNIETNETDLGEFIQQLAGETPYHIVTPAMHHSKEDVAKIYHDKKGTPENLSPQEIMTWTREHLHEKYLTAGAGITGANFLVADIGAIAI